MSESLELLVEIDPGLQVRAAVVPVAPGSGPAKIEVSLFRLGPDGREDGDYYRTAAGFRIPVHLVPSLCQILTTAARRAVLDPSQAIALKERPRG